MRKVRNHWTLVQYAPDRSLRSATLDDKVRQRSPDGDFEMPRVVYLGQFQLETFFHAMQRGDPVNASSFGWVICR
jgi:hypothetical protein